MYCELQSLTLKSLAGVDAAFVNSLLIRGTGRDKKGDLYRAVDAFRV